MKILYRTLAVAIVLGTSQMALALPVPVTSNPDTIAAIKTGEQPGWTKGFWVTMNAENPSCQGLNDRQFYLPYNVGQADAMYQTIMAAYLAGKTVTFDYICLANGQTGTANSTGGARREITFVRSL